MNAKEIYVLNRALDDKDIRFMPSSKSLKMLEFMVKAVKDGLIERGILKKG